MRMKMMSAAPAQKVLAGGFAGAITTVGVWALQEFAGVAVPGNVASAVTMLISVAAAYYVPPAHRDQIEAAL